MKTRSALGVLGLAVVAFGVAAQAPLLPDAAIVQSATQQIRAAINSGDADAMMAASLALNEQVIRMQGGDPRAFVATQLQNQVFATLERATTARIALQHMQALDAQAAATAQGRNLSSWTLVEQITRVLTLSGDLAGARDYLKTVLEREEPLLGRDFSPVRTTRMLLIQTSASLGEHTEALALLEQELAASVAIYGEGAPESVSILITMARVHLDLEDYGVAAARADQAAAIVRQNLTQLAPQSEQLGDIFAQTARLEDAREMYQIMEGILVDAFPGVASFRVRLYRSLAIVNARLGDGAAARNYLSAVTDLAETTFSEETLIRLEVMLVEAQIYSLAGLFDAAQTSLAGVEDYVASKGLSDAPGIMYMLANQYMFAGNPERARELAARVVEGSRPEDPGYASAGNVLVISSALSDPPESLLDLARELLERAQRESPELKHLREQYAVAMARAAAGSWEESERIQKLIIDTEATDTGFYITNALQWESYAAALRALGRDGEAQRVDGILEAQRSPLREAFTDQSPRDVFVEQRSGFGFEIRLTDAGWRRSRGAALGLPMAAFAASFGTAARPDSGSIVIIPVLLPEGVSARTVIGGYLTTIYSDWDRLEEWTNGTQSGFAARSIDPHFQTGQPVVHASRIVVEPGAVYIFLTSVAVSDPEAVAATDAALDQVVIYPGATLDDLSPPEREHHGDVLNYTGNVLFQSGQYEDARTFFRLSLDFGDNPVRSENYAYANYYLGDLDSLVAAVDSHTARFGESAKLLLWRADSYAQAGEIDPAVSDYDRAFDLGAVDDEQAGAYVDLLLASERETQAGEFLDAYALANDTLEVHAMQAALGFTIGDDERTDRALAILTDPERSNADGVILAAAIVADRDGPTALASLMQQIIANRLDSPDLFVLVASFQASSGLIPDAHKTIAQGLERYPDNVDLESLAEQLPAPAPPDA